MNLNQTLIAFHGWIQILEAEGAHGHAKDLRLILEEVLKAQSKEQEQKETK